jgi:hypothetical protein
MHSNTKTVILVLAALVAGLIIGYMLNNNQVVVAADNSITKEDIREIVREEVAAMECPCKAPVVECGTVATVTETIEIPVPTYITVTEISTVTVPGNSPVPTTTVPVSEPVTVYTPEPTPVPTSTPVVEVTPTPEVEDEGKDKQKCNQGLGNGSEGCDPGNSNHNQVSNDEGTNADGSAKVPGNGGRKNSQPLNKEQPKAKKEKACKGKKCG